MQIIHHYVDQLVSTNQVLKTMHEEQALPEGYVLQAGFQTLGRGQGNNQWESDKDKNLLFSLLLLPHHLEVKDQFLISQMVSLGIIDVLRSVGDTSEANSFSIKWPNDLYWNHRKIGGILIENSWQGNSIAHSIVGIGLNVNQQQFRSEAPNPISMSQIAGVELDVKPLLFSIVESVVNWYMEDNAECIRECYLRNMYRREGWWTYRDAQGEFKARIKGINPEGGLILQDSLNQRKTYYFKEVQFVP